MVLGCATSRASAVFLFSLTIALNAALETGESSSTGCADYIRAGLGYDGLVPITETEYQYYTATEQITVTAGTPASDAAFAAASACASSWRAYDRQNSTNVIYKNIKTVVTTTLNTSITYGTGNVYSTEPRYNIPIACGNFTPTRTANRIFNITSTTITDVLTTSNATLLKATPKCHSITPDECSKLYVDYISSLGLPRNASVPKVTPAPANSPPCPAYYYKPSSTCSHSFVTSYSNDCTIMGNSVQLFYFPPGSTTTAPDPAITDPPLVVYEYAPGTTFTSPSIYLKFDYLSAVRVINDDSAVKCKTCDKQGCREAGVDGGQAIKVEGTSIHGQLVTLAPDEVSSIVLDFNEHQASSIISTMAHGLAGYADVMKKVIGNLNVTAKPLNLSDVIHPPPEAYYLQPLDNAPGCDLTVPQPECSTIFEGAYRAIISLPQEVTGFQGAWKSCFPVIYGVYDPPIALTQASIAATPTLPPGYKPTPNGGEGSETPQTAEPANLPQIPPIARPTAVPDQGPDKGQIGDGPSAPTLPPGGSPSNGGSSGGNGASDGPGNGGSGNGGSGNGGSSNDGSGIGGSGNGGLGNGGLGNGGSANGGSGNQGSGNTGSGNPGSGSQGPGNQGSGGSSYGDPGSGGASHDGGVGGQGASGDGSQNGGGSAGGSGGQGGSDNGSGSSANGSSNTGGNGSSSGSDDGTSGSGSNGSGGKPSGDGSSSPAATGTGKPSLAYSHRMNQDLWKVAGAVCGALSIAQLLRP